MIQRVELALLFFLLHRCAENRLKRCVVTVNEIGGLNVDEGNDGNPSGGPKAVPTCLTLQITTCYGLMNQPLVGKWSVQESKWGDD